MASSFDDLVDSPQADLDEIRTVGSGPQGELPLSPELLRDSPSGDLFGLTQSAGMGWNPAELLRDQFLILGTQGGIRAEDGRPIALGYHTGHWEIGLQMRACAEELKRLARLPFAAFVSDPCDGRSQGTPAMMDSLAYRNDAAIVLRRLIRSLPMRKGVLGVATCDKGLPAMMLALAGEPKLPGVIVPGGVTLPAANAEDAGKVQSIGARFAHGEMTLEEAAEMGCRACGSPGGGCQFLGTAATSQVIAEALGMALPHAALAPSGQPVWLDVATRSARAVVALAERGITLADILTDAAIENSLAVHAAVGGSTNLLLHVPAIAFAAGLKRPTVDDWIRVNRRVPRIVDVLPNGPVGHPTVRLYLAGGVPEVMLHLRELGLLHLDALTATGEPLSKTLDWWERSERRSRLRTLLRERDGVDPDDVIMSPARAKQRGLTSTVTFPTGNIAPEGSVIKSTAIDPEVIDADGVYRHTGPARVFTTERDAVAAIKGRTGRAIQPGDVIVLMGRGPLGAGMEEIYQITSALRYLKFGKHVAVVTDARFSGVSTGACIGHVGPEALAGGSIGKLRDGDVIAIEVDCRKLTGRVDFVGDGNENRRTDCQSVRVAQRPGRSERPGRFTDRPTIDEESGGPAQADGHGPPHEISETDRQAAAAILAKREPHPALAPDPLLPDDTRLWALLQQAGGGTWGGCVYDVDAIARLLAAGREA